MWGREMGNSSSDDDEFRNDYRDRLSGGGIETTTIIIIIRELLEVRVRNTPGRNGTVSAPKNLPVSTQYATLPKPATTTTTNREPKHLPHFHSHHLPINTSSLPLILT